MKILVVSPHADDSEIGCGGYVHKLASRGADIRILTATIGRLGIPNYHQDYELRLSESTQALSHLQVSSHRVLVDGFDSRLHHYPMGDMVGLLDAELAEYNPDMFLMPLPSFHQDHKYMWDACIAAVRPSRLRKLKTILAYEYPLSGWGDGHQYITGTGGLYVDITENMPSKMLALKEYDSQLDEAGSILSLAGIDLLGRQRGMETGCTYAELFHVMRMMQ